MGDDGIETFFRTDYPTMVAQLSRQLGPGAQAEDAVQESLVRAWEQERGGARIASLPGWVRLRAVEPSGGLRRSHGMDLSSRPELGAL